MNSEQLNPDADESNRICGVKLCLRRPWQSSGETYAIGTAFQNGDSFSAAELAAEFDRITDIATVERKLDELNGFFSILTVADDQLISIVGRLASYPLFYSANGARQYVSDDPSWVRSQVGDTTYNQTAEIEYLLSGYVTGRKTLSPHVSQALSGEYVAFKPEAGSSPDRHRWYVFPHDTNMIQDSDETLMEQLDEVLVNVYERLIEYADGRPIVVSLSSGHDSRLNLIMLARLGYDNLIALTHGAEDGETTLCKYIADDFGIPWVYVPSSHDEWYQWYNSAERERFQAASRYLDRIPTLEGALSVRTAREAELLPDDSVFITGDGVISTGEHIPTEFTTRDTISADEVYDTIVQSHYKYWEWDDEIDEILHEQVAAGIGRPTVASAKEAIAAMERWDWQERQAKFIPRKHIFEFWDYDWWMPLWDEEFVNFWCRLPVDAKADKQIFRNYVENLHAQVADVDADRVDETLWQGSQLGQKVKHAARNTRLDPTGTTFDKVARKAYFSLVNPVQYDDQANFGIMRQEQFAELQTGLLPIVHAFQAMEVLGRVSFDPPEIRNVPSGDTLTLNDFNA
ncbi:hypothetical protein HWV23_15565 [Natronomonas halophila]|uniref:hypothetical protein n=1 Tax=Natronomonas halophila TaxID=2747817 RepID=UPI0015B74590|nr:hypothetical protein [Natronomonas halophila]QLD87081.1 hypothetical protein HWV23_15565 [Natronomonas halophila]